MDQWFVSDRGKKSGPLSTSDLVAMVVSNDVSDATLVWKDGMTDWQPLLAHFKRPPILNLTQTKTTAAPPPAEPLAARSDFFRRYWRGGYSLPVSFWLVGLLGNLSFLFLAAVFASLQSEREYEPYSVFGGVAGLWIAGGAWGCFQLIGTWRSAVRYRVEKKSQGKSSFWGVAAQFAVLLGAFGSAAALAQFGYPQLAESWAMAFDNDPSLPDFTLRIMRNGTELEIAGGLKYGVARDVEKIMRASPQIKVVHLNSIGGRIGEAEKLNRLIKSRRLITYTSGQCLSACPIAFAAGKERWLRAGAKLGYHSGSFGGHDYSESMRSALLSVGLDSSFVSRAVSHTHAEMWYPTVPELAAAKVISGVTDEYRFAASGYGIRPGQEDFKEQLRRVSFFRALEEAAPEVFATTATKFQQAYVEGVPEGTILDELRDSQLSPVLTARMSTADNAVLAEFAALIADQYAALGSKNAQYCYDYAVKGATTTLVNQLPADLRSREIALSEKILKGPKVRDTPRPNELERLYGKVSDALAKKYSAEDMRLLSSSEKLKAPQYAKYCQMATAMFREISRLPLPEAGSVMRDIYKDIGRASPK
jgi:hypothetical protein